MSLPILTMTDVRLAFGGKPLFEGVTFTLAKGERAALVGRNGAGKSTLMRLITGRHEPDDGEMWIHPGTVITTVEQEPDLSAFETVLDYTTSGGAEAWRAEAELGHFGVDPTVSPSILSGGQIRRAALAKAFALDPDVLLLDEPTNHLDVPMIETLETRLIGFNGAVLLVSHDRRFMENVTTNTLWLRDGVVLKSPKGYGEFERWAEEIEEAEIRQLEKLKTQLKAEEHWLQRGVTGRRARNMGRLHKLKAMRAEAARRKAAIQAQKAKAGISAEEAGHQSRKVIEAFGLTKAYGDLKIVEGLDFKILRGDRVGFIGPNGVGKTTLLKLLLGELERDSGNVKLNPALRITYLDQTRDTLRPKDTLWEALAPQGGDSLMVQGRQRHVAAYAKDFLFKPDQLRQPVAALSGGERNRLTLAIALAQSTDVLVLDEPTNDLDMQTLDLLEDMLLNFEGTLILVSHDRAFLDATVTSCLVPLGDGQWVETAGGWTDAQSQIKGKPGKASKADKKPKAAKPKTNEPKKQTKLSFKDQHRLKEVEEAMPQLEAEIVELETQLSDPNLFNENPEAFNRINARLEAARNELEQAELDWMEIEEKKEMLTS
ncbi:MAG: ABC-F family ATP-binding cassette domain-containing protein [Hyphomonadaceae bacterium]|nr:ABC-F family ATP-binding cassette domain-containing protein [Hyphomonadaceae bacterium]